MKSHLFRIGLRKLFQNKWFYIVLILIVIIIVLLFVILDNQKKIAKTNNYNNSAVFNLAYQDSLGQANLGHDAQALKQLNQIVTYDNNQKAMVLNEEGLIYMLNKQYSRSLHSYLVAIELLPGNKNSAVFGNIAVDYQMLGNKTEAIKYYQKALNLYKNASGPTVKLYASYYQKDINSLEQK